MPIKKRFSISADLATGIRNTIESVTHHEGQLHYDMMLLNLIEPDPNNPRQMSISKREVQDINHYMAGFNETQLKDFEALKELSTSIKRVGIRNAIEVYKEGTKYRIISGERRYLAAILSGLQTVPVRINQKPDDFNLRYTQWIENINRKDLSLWEKYNNLLSISEAYTKVSKTPITEKSLQELIGISAVQSYRYFCLLNADKKIIALIKAGKLNNLKLVQELVSMKDRIAKEQILNWIEARKTEVTSLANYKEVAGKKRVAMPSINLGKIKNFEAARFLLNHLLEETLLSKYKNRFQDIDWSSNKVMSKSFKKLFKLLEAEVNELEPVND